MSSGSAYFLATDDLAIDSRAPWMAVAYRELKAGVKEFKTKDSFVKLFYKSLVQEDVAGRKHLLLEPMLKEQVDGELAAEKALVAQQNAPIAKYLATVRTDPRYGKSAPVPAIRHGKPRDLAAKGRGQTVHWQVTAWCAAFVNWCLQEAGSPHLGYATARSWLSFGTPLAVPVVGCITIMPPMSTTGSGTGHVGFFVKSEGRRTYLLGGNQHDAVNVTGYSVKPVGYRWPTKFNHLMMASSATV